MIPKTTLLISSTSNYRLEQFENVFERQRVLCGDRFCDGFALKIALKMAKQLSHQPFAVTFLTFCNQGLLMPNFVTKFGF